MVLAILLLIVAILCAVAVFREFKKQNFLGVGFAGISMAVFGWFSVMTLYTEIVSMLTEKV